MVQQVKLQFGAPAPLFRVPGTGLCLCLCSHPSCLLRQPGRWQMVAQVLGPRPLHGLSSKPLALA